LRSVIFVKNRNIDISTLNEVRSQAEYNFILHYLTNSRIMRVKRELVKVKKYLFILLSIVLISLVACGDGNETQKPAEEPIKEKKTEMGKYTALNYMEEMTGRYLGIDDHKTGSFEEKSEIQASISKSESILAEIEEEYDTEQPLIKELTILANAIKGVSEQMLEGEYDKDRAVLIGEQVGEISRTYLDDELPPTLKIKMLSNQ